MERCVFLSVYTAAIFSVQPAATARQSVLRECKSQNGLVGWPSPPLKWPHRRVPDYFPVYPWKSDPESFLDIKSWFFSVIQFPLSWPGVLKTYSWPLAWPQKTWKLDSIYFIRLIPILTHNDLLIFVTCGNLQRRSPVHKSQQYVTQQGQCQQFTVHSQHIHVNIVVSKF